MKLYTRTGDDGSTGLCGHVRLSKAAVRVAAYGAVDEANAAIGVVVSMSSVGAMSGDGAICSKLQHVQTDLFTVGAQLATAPKQKPDVAIASGDIERLEQWIDEATGLVPELRSFILPGGATQAAWLHFARTVCRRAERAVVHLMASEPVDVLVLTYLNRLSDLLFVLARLANHNQGVQDIPWVPNRG